MGSKQKCVEAASRAKNPLDTIQYESYKSDDGGDFRLICRTKGDMDAKTLKWTFKLAGENVGPFYKSLNMGWQPKIKQSELNKNWARFLVALDKEKPVGYAMFRFDMDNDCSVLYCYEIQVSAPYQRKGLGKFMMKTLEDCARHWLLDKIILTVLINNDNSLAFFKALGYVEDETSPDVPQEAEFKILSKSTLN